MKKMMSIPILLLILSSCTSIEHQRTISAAQIKEMVRSLQNATNSKDASTVMSHFSSNATIHVKYPRHVDREDVIFDKTSYEEDLREAFRISDKLFYECKIDNISISKDSRTATVVLTEYQTQNSEIYGVTSSFSGIQTMRIEIINGKPQISKVVMKVQDLVTKPIENSNSY